MRGLTTHSTGAQIRRLSSTPIPLCTRLIRALGASLDSEAQMKLSITILLLSFLVVLSDCHLHVGSINVEGENQPRFTFIGKHVISLVVYRIPRKYLNKRIPLDEVTKNNPNIQWRIEGEHDATVPVNYGNVPEGMKEIVPAKPLAENTIYFASTYVGTEETAAFVGQYFVIRNGRTLEVHELLDENSVDN
jgi:hypothetical protein